MAKVLISPSTGKSSNFKQLVMVGAPAIIEAMMLMFNTPLGSHQEDPMYGFDLNDFLFKVKSSSEVSDLKNRMVSMLKSVTLNSDIDVNFNRTDNGETIEIFITINAPDGKTYNVPLAATREGVKIIKKLEVY